MYVEDLQQWGQGLSETGVASTSLLLSSVSSVRCVRSGGGEEETVGVVRSGGGEGGTLGEQ